MGYQHWIITNRLVVKTRMPDGAIHEAVDPRVNEPLPTFRVATFTPLDPEESNPEPSARAKQLESRVRFLPDVQAEDYLAASETVHDRAPSRDMFNSLYHNMLAAKHEEQRREEQGQSYIKGDVLFFIHGFNYGWYEALSDLQMLHEKYVLNPESPISQIIYFTWPSYGSLTRYLSDQEISQPSGMLLGRFWSKTVRFFHHQFGRDSNGERREFCDRKIHLAAHSMGNQVLEHFADAINDLRYLNLNLFGEVLLLHADADWNVLEPGRPLYNLPEYCDRIHVYNHHSDDALLVSEVTKNSEKRLGRHGPRDLDKIPPRTLVVDCTARIGQDELNLYRHRDPALINAATVLGREDDSVSLRERLFDHWGYINRKEQISDICGVLRGESSSSEQLRNTRSHKHGPLFTLKRG